MKTRDIFYAILLKEQIKLRKFFWIPFVAVLAVVIDAYISYKGVISHKGATALWAELIYKQSIHFSKLSWVFIASGMLFAYVQFMPECKDKRLRLMFHLPVSYRFSIYSMISVGVVLNLLLTLSALLLLQLLFFALHFPYELSFEMLMTTLPWALVGVISYLAAAVAIADSAIWRKFIFGGMWAVFVSLLTVNNGFFSYKEDLWIYTLVSLLWLFAFECAALETKGDALKIDISKIACFLLCVISLLWFVPNFYNKAVKLDRFQLSGFFSPISKEFIILEIGTEKMAFKDETGELLSTVAAHKMLPFMFSGNVEKWGGFPIQTDKGEITYELAANSVQSVSVTPQDVLAQNLPFHLLYESAPVGTTLETPPDVLLIKSDRVLFIDCVDGAVNREKSEKFTQALKETGVLFPIQTAASNPSNLKPFDEGMFLADSANRLFQLKIVEGEPYVRDTGTVMQERVLYINVDEKLKRIFYGAVVTENGVYLNMYDGTMQKLPLVSYDPKTDAVTARFTPFYKSVVKKDLSDKNAPIELIAADESFQTVRTHEQNIPDTIIKKREYVSYGLSFLSPFSLTQFSYFSNEVLLQITPAPNLIFAGLGILFALILYVGIRGKKIEVFAIFAICFTGILGLLAYMAFGQVGKRGRD
ncbi:MAG: DUF4857 domain-containing protein [Campylobacteraceae bacterium]|jgi:hypothetical protein|nr:DUF4857 domain-containing protein [Campylobacteraceae bacterium]